MFDLIISRYFWVVCIAVTLFNFWRGRSGKSAGAATPVLAEDDSTRGRILAAMIAPWVVMGFGIIFGGVPGVWNYFRPQDLNPYVWAWYLCIFLISCAFAYWVFLADGAKKAVELRLVQAYFFGRQAQVTERWIKLYAAASPLFVILWIWFAWHLDAPIPK
ncbi:MAG: hypothetical protein ACLPTM_02815 [Steroidobacteraceae bacterium]